MSQKKWDKKRKQRTPSNNGTTPPRVQLGYSTKQQGIILKFNKPVMGIVMGDADASRFAFSIVELIKKHQQVGAETPNSQNAETPKEDDRGDAGSGG